MKKKMPTKHKLEKNEKNVISSYLFVHSQTQEYKYVFLVCKHTFQLCSVKKTGIITRYL